MNNALYLKNPQLICSIHHDLYGYLKFPALNIQ